jgi:TPR repeat protein
VNPPSQTFQDVLGACESGDFARARRLGAELARAGDTAAMHQLGRWHAEGNAGCSRDPGLAAYWFFQAWQAGLDAAEQEIIPVRADLEAAAEAGSAEAQNALALLLCFGHDEPAAAAEWFELAARQNHPEALRTLGYLLEAGRGVPQDETRAADYYRRAAELGDPFAQFNFAILLADGRGVPRDRAAAVAWLTRAAEQGMAEAHEPLAHLLDSGG